MNRFQFPILPAVLLLVAFILGSCAKQDETLSAWSGPQLGANSCEHLNTESLDLTEGFRGTFRRAPVGADHDFQVDGHDPQYPFNNGVQQDPECGGYCSIQITFEPEEGETIPNGTNLLIEQVVVNYSQGGINHSDASGYMWNYPHLTVEDIYADHIMDYEITFYEDQGDLLRIADVEVVEGLCVIANIGIGQLISLKLDPDNTSGN